MPSPTDKNNDTSYSKKQQKNRISNPTDKTLDELRQDILSIPVGRHDNDSPIYLEDVFPNIASSEFADDIVQLIETCTNTQTANQLKALLDANMIKPEYHNLVVGKWKELNNA